MYPNRALRQRRSKVNDNELDEQVVERTRDSLHPVVWGPWMDRPRNLSRGSADSQGGPQFRWRAAFYGRADPQWSTSLVQSRRTAVGHRLGPRKLCGTGLVC